MFSEDGCLEILITLVSPHQFPFHSILQHLQLCSQRFIVTFRNVVHGRAVVLNMLALAVTSALFSLARATHNKPCKAAEEH